MHTSPNFLVYLLLMALTTYLIRMIPFAAFSGKIRSKFVRDFLYYVPYAVLSAMTFPAIFYATGNKATAIFGCMVAFLLAYFELSLVTVAAASCACAYLLHFFV